MSSPAGTIEMSAILDKKWDNRLKGRKSFKLVFGDEEFWVSNDQHVPGLMDFAATLTEGDVVNFEYTVNGKYNNIHHIEGFVAPEGPTEAARPPTATGQGAGTMAAILSEVQENGKMLRGISRHLGLLEGHNGTLEPADDEDGDPF